jgi:copper(I)-binding protein
MAAISLLSGCAAGFNATSVKPYAPSDGVMSNTGHLRILNALVVASPDITNGVVSGVIVNRGHHRDKLTGLTSPDGKVDLTGVGTLRPGTSVRLGADTNPSATISGLTALPGETITLKLRFAEADPVTIRTVVIAAKGPYASVTPGPTTPAE